MSGNIKRRGLMLVVSSPSGAGKTTIARALLERDPGVILSVSATTRPKRPGETDGRDYIFVAPRIFEELAATGQFLEHAKVFGHRYGTPAAPVETALEAGRDVLFDIDWQGTQQLAEKARDDLVRVFILPPSTEELERRLKGRARDPDEVVRERMAKAADEMSHWAEYDYVIVNRDLEASLSQVAAVLAAERLKRERQIGLSDFVEGLRGGA
ncbi:MAG: guanylate kinase [Rhodospirillales bacterium]|nr:guanylate kinase [Rhodospirillales bacterium]MDH3910288.1 guanylate kinase [Rhodospirillales bacterium]MDH3917949.1 guanylate kinase [Rhodospirillales bacterium]MDH3967057.1 guanylate kinase [Rhodospirillales bacterium]